MNSDDANPNVDEFDPSWMGDGGGIQGLLQKTTLFQKTLLVLVAVASLPLVVLLILGLGF